MIQIASWMSLNPTMLNRLLATASVYITKLERHRYKVASSIQNDNECDCDIKPL